MPRSDRQTETRVQPEYFSDFSIDFSKNPITGMLSRLTNENSVKQSVQLLVLTYLTEWPHANELGSQVGRLLFEPADVFTLDGVRTTVFEVLRNHEPRVTVQSVVVQDDPDTNSYIIYVVFTINNTNQQASVTVLLKRVR